MNSQQELEAELRRVAARHAPSPAEVRGDLADRGVHSGGRRRNAPWIAAAAAVALIAGGVTAAAAVLQHDGASSAASGGNNSDNGQPASTPGTSTSGSAGSEAGSSPTAGTGGDATGTLVAHSAEAVTTPVTAQPPHGLTDMLWRQKPEALTVTWRDHDAWQELKVASAADPNLDEAPVAVPQVGYVITADRDGDLRTLRAPNAGTPAVERSPITVAGHDATLDTAEHGTVGAFGHPAHMRISWQIGDGRWIHVWAADGDAASSNAGADASPSPMLKAFAATVTEQPQTLQDASDGVTVGLTVPGLTHRFTMDEGSAGSTVFLCPSGVDPLSPGYNALLKTRAEVDGTDDGSGPVSGDPIKTGPCLSAFVGPNTDGIDPYGHLARGTSVQVGDRTAHVLLDKYATPAAWVDLTDDRRAQVMAPWSAHLSTEQLAQLAASVQFTAGS